ERYQWEIATHRPREAKGHPARARINASTRQLELRAAADPAGMIAREVVGVDRIVRRTYRCSQQREECSVAAPRQNAAVFPCGSPAALTTYYRNLRGKKAA